MSNDKCYLCLRVGTLDFYKEMHDLGLTNDVCSTALLLIKACYETDPTMLSGKSSRAIKASVIYIAQFIERKRVFTQNELTNHYNLGDNTLRRTYKYILEKLHVDGLFYRLTNALGQTNRQVTNKKWMVHQIE